MAARGSHRRLFDALADAQARVLSSLGLDDSAVEAAAAASAGAAAGGDVEGMAGAGLSYWCKSQPTSAISSATDFDSCSTRGVDAAGIAEADAGADAEADAEADAIARAKWREAVLEAQRRRDSVLGALLATHKRPAPWR